MQKLRQGDEVIVLTGKDRGKFGKILQVLEDRKLIVEGINRAKKHQKGNPNAGVSGGIVEKDLPIDASNVALYNPKTKKADRVGFKFDNGTKVRFFKSTNEIVDL
jgi:large subunit ribosomal protein L24